MPLLAPLTCLTAGCIHAASHITRRTLSQDRCLPHKIAASIIVTFNHAIRNELSKVLPITRYRNQKSHQDYHTLLLQRPGTSSFGSKVVFPGGVVSREDFSSVTWHQVFDYRTYSPDSFRSKFTAPMYATLQQYFCNDTKQSSLQAHIGLRLCALRELFEETGLLLIEDDSRANDASAAGIVLSPSETTKWHDRLRLDPAAFLLLYASIGCRPPLLSLKEWSNWMPPDEYSPRFDTMFFFVHLHSFESCATHTKPILKLTDEAYELYADEPLSFLPISLQRFIPPQAYELGRLSQFPHLNQLATFAAQRATLGCRCWRPITAEITIAGTKCKLFLLPGDQRYTDVCVAHGPRTFCVGDLALDTQRNRFVINPDCDDFWLDSTTSELGHVPPITRQVYFSLYEAT